jgi:serine protein kinase
MTTPEFDFRAMIQKDRDESVKKQFEGTFLDYLKLVKSIPEVAVLSHQRLYELIISQGLEAVKTDENPRLRRIYGNDIIKKYSFFEDDFFGIDKTIMKIVRYFHSAAMAGEEARQVLYLVGPVGAGKSSLMEALKRALECAAPIYSLKGCPMREEPLHLIPKHLRKDFENTLNVKIEGDLCPICRYRLKNEYNGEYESFPVESTGFSIRSRKGIGVVPPVDPNNQDTSILIN